MHMMLHVKIGTGRVGQGATEEAAYLNLKLQSKFPERDDLILLAKRHTKIDLRYFGIQKSNTYHARMRYPSF